jgi:hypothetical protein
VNGVLHFRIWFARIRGTKYRTIRIRQFHRPIEAAPEQDANMAPATINVPSAKRLLAAR